jgi:hypothetical protein
MDLLSKTMKTLSQDNHVDSVHWILYLLHLDPNSACCDTLCILSDTLYSMYFFVFIEGTVRLVQL